jgi:hypothetical protein
MSEVGLLQFTKLLTDFWDLLYNALLEYISIFNYGEKI